MDRSNPPADGLIKLLHAAGHISANAAWHALTGGRTNQIWCTQTPLDQDLIVKQYHSGQDNPLFPNDPEAEAVLLAHLDHANLAPKLLDRVDFEGVPVLVYLAAEGEVWHKGTRQIARAVDTLHRQPIPRHKLRDVASSSREIAAEGKAILASLRHQSAEARALNHTMPVVDIPPLPTEQHVLLHGDLVPGNLIISNGPDSCVTMIDWQCPAVGDPCWDYATFLSPAMQLVNRGRPLSLQETDDFLAELCDRKRVARYRSLAPLYHWRMAAYCLWKVSGGAAEYHDGYLLESEAMAGCSAQ